MALRTLRLGWLQVWIDRCDVKAVLKRTHLLWPLRRLRFFLLLGPWNPIVVRHFQRHSRNPPLPAVANEWSEGFDAASAARKLGELGWAPAPSLPPDRVAALHEYAASRPRFMESPHRDCDTVRQIVFDDRVVKTLGRYLGVEPVFFDSTMWWSASDSRQEGDFHYDVGDFRSAVVFYYLSEVTQGAGAHEIIEGTHQRKRLRDFVRPMIDEHEAKRRYGSRIRAITGPPGTGWFEDITAHHRRSETDERRLVLKARYLLQRDPASGWFIRLLIPGLGAVLGRPQVHLRIGRAGRTAVFETAVAVPVTLPPAEDASMGADSVAAAASAGEEASK